MPHSYRQAHVIGGFKESQPLPNAGYSAGVLCLYEHGILLGVITDYPFELPSSPGMRHCVFGLHKKDSEMKFWKFSELSEPPSFYQLLHHKDELYVGTRIDGSIPLELLLQGHEEVQHYLQFALLSQQDERSITWLKYLPEEFIREQLHSSAHKVGIVSASYKADIRLLKK